MSAQPPTPSPLPDTGIDPPLGDSLSLAYDAPAPAVRRPWLTLRHVLYAVLALLAVNVWLWWTYTRSAQVLGEAPDARRMKPVAAAPAVNPPVLAPAAAAPPLPLAPAITKPPTSVTAAATAATLPSAAPSLSPTNRPGRTTPGLQCLLWEFTNNADLKRADTRLAQQNWTAYTVEQAPEPPSYMVILGPYDNKPAQDTALRNLAALKIKDYITLTSGAVSLGVLPTTDAATSLKNSLQQRGVNGLSIIERRGSKLRPRYRFDQLTPTNASLLGSQAVGLGALRTCDE